MSSLPAGVSVRDSLTTSTTLPGSVAATPERRSCSVARYPAAMNGASSFQPDSTPHSSAIPIAFRGAPKRDDFVVEAGQLLALTEELRVRFASRQNADDFEHVGATDGHSIMVTTYDVERFNALDKLVGWSVLSSEPIDRMIVTLTGRLCAASIFRLARAGAKIVVGDGSPTAQAVKIAQGAGVTLVGGVGNDDPVIYSHPWRIDRS